MEPFNSQLGETKVKKNCDELRRILSVCVADSINVRDSIKLGFKKRGQKKFSSQKKYSSEIISKDDFYRDSQEWRHIDKVIDREKDRYTETIKDKNGNIVHQTDEPLTKHQGRGSAKKTVL